MIKAMQFNSIIVAMSNTLWIAYVSNDLAHGVLQNIPIRVLISF
jgi:hypothetical protein